MFTTTATSTPRHEQMEDARALHMLTDLAFQVSTGNEWQPGTRDEEDHFQATSPLSLSPLQGKPDVIYFHGALSPAQTHTLALLHAAKVIRTQTFNYRADDPLTTVIVKDRDALRARAAREPQRLQDGAEAADLLNRISEDHRLSVRWEWDGIRILSTAPLEPGCDLKRDAVLGKLEQTGAIRYHRQYPHSEPNADRYGSISDFLLQTLQAIVADPSLLSVPTMVDKSSIDRQVNQRSAQLG